MTVTEKSREPRRSPPALVLVAYGAAAGLLGLAVGYPLAGLLVRPYTDRALLGIVIAPPVLIALGGLVPRWRRSALWLALGALIGIGVAVGVLLGGISLIAGVLSDPAGGPAR